MGETQRLKKSSEKSRSSRADHCEADAPARANAPPAPASAWAGPVGAPFTLGGGAVQRKVAIGASNDVYERQADQVANRVAGGGTVPQGSISPIAPASASSVGQRETKPDDKKKDEKPAAPVQREARSEDTKKDPKSAATQLQRQAKPEEKKKDEKPPSAPVQKQAKPEEKKKDEKPASPPVQKQAKPNEQKKEEKPAAAPVQKQAKPEEKKKDEKPASAPVQKQAKGDDKKKDEKPSAAPVQKQSKPDEKKKDEKPASAPVQKQAKADEKKKEEKPAAAPVQKQAKADEKKKDEKPTSAPVQKQAKTDDKKKDEKTAAPVQREVKPEDKKKEEVPGTLPAQRAEKDEPAKEESGSVQASSAGGGAAATRSMESVASQAVANKGPGEPLQPATRGTLESRMGTDLSDVRVHNDEGAQSAADALNARAFTHENDIWLGRGESQSDTRLMAHEATHVVQQTGSVHRQLAQRDEKPPKADAPVSAEQAQKDLETFPLPPVKGRHKTVYEAWASAGNLKRTKGYDRGEPDQKDSVWIPAVKNNIKGLDKLHLDPTFKGKKTVEVPKGKKKTGTYNELLEVFAAPDWDRHGKSYNYPFEVDHIVELQVGSWDGGTSGPANTIENMELLDKRSNASAGASTKSGIRRNVGQFLRRTGKPDDKKAVDEYLANNDVTFHKVGSGEIGSVGAGESQYWSKAEIEAGKQLEDAEPVKNVGEAGSATSFALLSPGGATVLGEYAHKKDALAIPVGSEVAARKIAGLNIKSIQLNSGYESAKAAEPIGSIQGKWDLPKGIAAPDSAMPIPLVKSAAGQYSGEIGSLPSLDASMEQMSAFKFDKVSLDEGGITANGKLTPSLSLLQKTPIDVRLRGRDLEFVYYYKPDDITLPIPGVSIDDASLGVFLGTRGFGAEGSVDFSVKNLGRGTLAAGIDSARNFNASGSFNFDSKLFDKAEVSVWYRNRAFGGSGELQINKPNKIRGIRSASIKVTFGEKTFVATGTVEPSIPGVRQASLEVSYSEDTGLIIGGNLQLAELPGISSGSVDVKVQKKPDGSWSVSAHGKAVPKIPGLNSELDVSYEDGAFDAAITAGFEKGMLKGTATVGATNRPVGDDNKPSGPPPEHSDKITFYGSGSATLRLAPWLQATAAIKFLPNGEVEITGKIGLPSVLNIFDEKKLSKNIFKIGIDIPILGFSVLGHNVGIFLEIGGGLDLDAGIGPGQLQDVELSVTYNPAHEEDTNVHGHAALHIPAHAGLRLFVSAALGAGIPLVDAKAGIELGGSLGIEGALHAAVDVDWSPKKGLVLDANAEIYAEPKFKFDITGFVLVELDLLFTTKTLYEKKWQLAAVEYGSGLRLGMKLPVHYEEGKPFNISLSDIQFEVPNIDAMSTIKGLFNKII
jgi:Domain of unknown function (DUF4157)